MRSPLRIFMDTASGTPEVLTIANKAVGMRARPPVVIEEGKKVLAEDGEAVQGGSSAIDSSTLGDYKVYGRGWIRPASMPKKKDQLPEEKEVDPDADLYKEEKEGDEWMYANEDFIAKLADKVAELIASIENEDDDTVDRSVESSSFDDDMFYDPEDDEEIDDTPYEMDGVEDEEPELDDEEDEDESEPSTVEEEKAVIAELVAGCSSFTIEENIVSDTFAIGLDKLLCEEIEKTVSKGELVRRKIVAGRRMKRMASKMRARRKVKFHRTDMKTIKGRVHKQALKMLKDKFAKSKGGRYADLSLSAKVDVDQMVKRRANMIPNIERKLLGSYRVKMNQRRKAKTNEKQ